MSFIIIILFDCVQSQATADVEFIASGKSIHAHKSILSLRCDYFRTMFSGDWQESRDGLVNWFA